MTTVSRSNSRVTPPVYKDYVNFLASYKNGKKEENFSPTLGTPTASNFQRSTSTVLIEPPPVKEKSEPSPVKEKNEPSKVTVQNLKSTSNISSFKEQKSVNGDSTEKPLKKSEIFIEIQPTKSVSEVSKMFENQNPSKKAAPSSTISSKIGIFEKQTSVEKKPKILTKPPKMVPIKTKEILPPVSTDCTDSALSPPPTPIITQNLPVSPAVPPPAPSSNTQNLPVPPPPPPPSTTQNIPVPPTSQSSGQSKIQATLPNGTTKFSVSTNEEMPPEIDRNNPLVKKLVYGALREFYGSYHEKATNMVSNLPGNMVVRSNGVQSRIEQIAATGGLEKLNGRVNPKRSEEP